MSDRRLLYASCRLIRVLTLLSMLQFGADSNEMTKRSFRRKNVVQLICFFVTFINAKMMIYGKAASQRPEMTSV